MADIFHFDPVDFRKAFPSFANLTDEQLQWFFSIAENTIIDNTKSSCFTLDIRKKFFYLLVAHQAQLDKRVADGNGDLVGNISSATEGSISVSVAPIHSPTAMRQWLNQTPFGLQFNALTTAYRSALLIGGLAPMPVGRDRYRNLWWFNSPE